jgi:hypothetical protein
LGEAREQGFPSIKLQVFATARFWDDSVYAGIRQLHKRKGFHPYSPNIGLLMGLPLFRLCYECDALSSHCEPRISFIPILLTRAVQGNQADNSYSDSKEVSDAQYYDKFGDEHPVRQLNCRYLDSFTHIVSDDLGRWDSYAKKSGYYV